MKDCFELKFSHWKSKECILLGKQTQNVKSETSKDFGRIFCIIKTKRNNVIILFSFLLLLFIFILF